MEDKYTLTGDLALHVKTATDAYNVTIKTHCRYKWICFFVDKANEPIVKWRGISVFKETIT